METGLVKLSIGVCYPAVGTPKDFKSFDVLISREELKDLSALLVRAVFRKDERQEIEEK